MPETQTFTDVQPLQQAQTFSNIAPIESVRSGIQRPNIPVEASATDKLASFASPRLDALKKAFQPAINASAPNVAHEIYKHMMGQPNNLKDIPGDAVMSWLMAGGAGPESEMTAAKTADEIPARPSMDRVANQPPEVLDRLRNTRQIEPPSDYVPPRPSLERIQDLDKATPEAPAQVPTTSTSQFPPRGPSAKFQYDPNVNPGKPTPRAGFDTNGITRDIDEDNAIEDAMRTDLGKHGYISNMQANREFAANNSMDTAKGTLQEQAKNSLIGGKLVDLSAKDIGSPFEPVEFLGGKKAFKTSGEWFVKSGNDWNHVTPDEMRALIEPGPAPVQSSSPVSPKTAPSEDLTEEWQKNLEYLRKKKAGR